MELVQERKNWQSMPHVQENALSPKPIARKINKPDVKLITARENFRNAALDEDYLFTLLNDG